MRKFKEYQYDHQVTTAKAHPDWFGSDRLNGEFKSKHYKFILKNGINNIDKELRCSDEDNRFNVIEYFRANGIEWWNGNAPSGHMCSSQIACLNHLFPLRYDHDAVLALANGAAGCRFFDDVETVGGDRKFPGYISFEVVTSTDYLNESNGKPLTRGSMCTSVDAVICAMKGEKHWLLPIEWKFVESYYRDDKSIEDYEWEKDGHGKGEERLRRYTNLINGSIQLHSLDDYNGSIYFQEPFYQLMRQTLWAEQAILNKDTFFPCATEYMHIHVVPDENGDLLFRKYRNVAWDQTHGMVGSWISCLEEKSRYCRRDPKTLFCFILSDEKLSKKYSRLIEYLSERYWK